MMEFISFESRLIQRLPIAGISYLSHSIARGKNQIILDFHGDLRK